MKKTLESHIFALHAPQEYQPLAHYAQSKSLTINNKDFYFRLSTVLRLHVGESFILFDHKYHMTCHVETITKKEIVISLVNFSENNVYNPTITCCIPLLKREALETLIDSATQLGATTIQLIQTDKAHRSIFDSKELERLQRIIYAAAEQSKNFAYPRLQPPLPLERLSYSSPTIFLDPAGSSCLNVLTSFTCKPPAALTLIIGPEGDLTEQEKEYLRSHNVLFMALTPTILRAEQAAALALGIFRSALQINN